MISRSDSKCVFTRPVIPRLVPLDEPDAFQAALLGMKSVRVLRFENQAKLQDLDGEGGHICQDSSTPIPVIGI